MWASFNLTLGALVTGYLATLVPSPASLVFSDVVTLGGGYELRLLEGLKSWQAEPGSKFVNLFKKKKKKKKGSQIWPSINLFTSSPS